MSKAKRSIHTGIRTPIKTIMAMAALFRKAATLLTGEAKRLKRADVRLRKLATAKPTSKKRRTTKKVVKKMVDMPTRPTTVAEISYALLSRKATPMTIGELATKVAKLKGRKADRVFASNLAAALTRDERVTRVERGMYIAK